METLKITEVVETRQIYDVKDDITITEKSMGVVVEDDKTQSVIVNG